MNFADENEFEKAIRRALRREMPSAQFADRVRVKISAGHRKRLTRYWLAVAAMVAVSAGAGTAAHDFQEQRHAEARRAGEQLMAALKITTSKLQTTHRMVRRRSNAT